MAQVKGRRRRRRVRISRPKLCRFCEDAVQYIDFKDVELFRRYITEQGKIIPRRVTGTCPTHQKMLAKAVKRARNLALVP